MPLLRLTDEQLNDLAIHLDQRSEHYEFYEGGEGESEGAEDTLHNIDFTPVKLRLSLADDQIHALLRYRKIGTSTTSNDPITITARRL